MVQIAIAWIIRDSHVVHAVDSQIRKNWYASQQNSERKACLFVF